MSIIPLHTEMDMKSHRTLARYVPVGTAEVEKHFVRLTPDRQSKRGAVWSKKPFALSTWSVVLEFRISGSGEHLFGDGMALWVVDKPYIRDGRYHGQPEDFIGVGVIVDTFRNSEAGEFHRDVSVVWNDGSKGIDNLAATTEGCDVPGLRYFESGGAFSVFNTSRLRLSYDDGVYSVDVDATSGGNWVSCASVTDLRGHPATPREQYVGVTATTGALADNHDVVSLKLYDNVHAATAACAARPERPKGVEAREVELEHKLAAVLEGIQTTLDRIDAATSRDEERLQMFEDTLAEQATLSLDERVVQVEKDVGKVFSAHIEDRVQALEAMVAEKVRITLAEKVTKLEEVVVDQMETRLSAIERALGGVVYNEIEGRGGSAWKIPLVVFIVLWVGFTVWVVRWYIYTRKISTW